MSSGVFRPRRIAFCIALPAGAGIVRGPLPLRAQSVWQQIKDQAKKTKEQMKQAAHQAGPPNQQQPAGGLPPGGASQPPARGGQQSASPDREASGPIHAPAGTKVVETVMAPLAPGAKFFVSPHGVHIATQENSGSRAVIYYDGVPGPKFDEILGGNANNPSEPRVVFSPDGKRYAYCGRIGDQLVVMVDGKELLRSPESQEGRFNGSSCGLGFTSNSEHLFFISNVVRSMAKGDMFTRFFLDGKEAALTTASGIQANGETGGVHAVFSPDGNHYAYVAIDPADNQKWALVIDGKVAPYRGGAPQWTADSKHLYTVLLTPVSGRGQVAEAMLDGKPFLRSDDIKLHVAPAGAMVVAEVNAASNTPRPLKFMVVDGKKVPGTEIVNQRGANFDQVTFSPDGKHYASRFSSAQGSQYVFVDGKAGQEYQKVDHIAFTSDSAKVTYTAFTNGKPYSIMGDQESNACLAPLVGPVIDQHGGLMIAPAGGRAGTICGLTGGDANLFMDGKTLPLPNGAQGGDDLRFSPDGQHYAYTAFFQGGERRLVIDGVLQMNSNMGTPSTMRGPYVFSPDSRHIAVDSAPPTPTGEYGSGIFLDGRYIPILANPGMKRLEFTADSKHIAWAQPVPGRNGFRIFVDGKAVAEADAAMDTGWREGWWDMAPDRSLSVLAQDDNNLKRITITPSPETSVVSLGGGGTVLAKRVQ
jgi:hypothetical protein